jgi:16S rRNA (guanine(966)-N(2))-methyltransferase RsmD
MRIISGSHARRVLRPPQGLPVRPTTDLAKESLFNILNNRIDIEDLRVLDLFAGTGNISFEFASRGAGIVVSVELNGKCADFITKTSIELKFTKLSTIQANVLTFLARPAGKYDVIFADPPYDMPNREKVPELIFLNNWLAEDGLFILEHDRAVNFKGNTNFIEERQYGKVHFSFFQNLQTENPEKIL